MRTRRDFFKLTVLGTISIFNKDLVSNKLFQSVTKTQFKIPICVSNWHYDLLPSLKAGQILISKGLAVDAVETGILIAENERLEKDLSYNSIFGSDGHIKLTACIIDKNGKSGTVSLIENIKNPISVARLVMIENPNAILAGDGAQKFAFQRGFKKENLWTTKSKSAFKHWNDLQRKYKNKDLGENRKNSRIIGMLALDSFGNLSGACTSLGAIEMKDNNMIYPLIGPCIFINNMIGGACSTHLNDLVVETNACQNIVELMGKGISPEEACKSIIEKIAKEYIFSELGFIALRKDGEIGAFGIRKGFQYSIWNEVTSAIIPSKCYFDERDIIKRGYCINEDCTACGDCFVECPVKAISKGDIYYVDPKSCTSCGACADVCPVNAVQPC
jgi:N4-(beta-N-acetylglucosaminyl)-L-asparaginase